LTRAVEVALIAQSAIKYDRNTYALVRSAADLRLFVDARREAHDVLRALAYRIIPWFEAVISIIQRFILVAAFRAWLSSK
jgi:hypothetical protein